MRRLRWLALAAVIAGCGDRPPAAVDAGDAAAVDARADAPVDPPIDASEARFGEVGGRELDLLVNKAQIAIVSFDQDQAELARDAYRRYGKGRHPAGLNHGDCFSYALSISSGEPLLFKGDDFRRTDLESVL